MSLQILKTKRIDEIIQCIQEGKTSEFQTLIRELQPYDLTQVFLHLPLEYQQEFLAYLSIEQLASFIQALPQSKQLEVLESLGAEKTAEVIDLMERDNLVALLTGLEQEKVDSLLSAMNKEDSAIVQNLMKYPPETAGRMMNDQYVWIPQSYTVRKAVDKLKDFAELAEFLNYLYVIDNDRKLVGVVSYRDLILADLYEKIEDIMQKRIVKVHVLTDQEEVAKLFHRYNFVTMPVVKEDNTLVGIVTFDDVIDVVYQEANEDIEKLSASGKAIDFKTKPIAAAYKRLPWLILLLFIGIISGSIIAGFEDTLNQVVALAFFMPLINGMTGNTGTQSLAVVVRGLTTNDMGLKRAIKLLFREMWVGIIIGITCGILISIIAYIWQGNIVLGFVVGSSLLITLVIGTLTGTIIPIFLYKLNMDPAVASGPLITTINDILSLLVYFGIATLFISQLV